VADAGRGDDMQESSSGLTGLPAVVSDKPAPDDSVVLRALRSHAARCVQCRDVAVCADGRQLITAMGPAPLRGIRVVRTTTTEDES
jgi:hypothetical protein